MPEQLRITEVLAEPGQTELWVTFSDQRTRRVRLRIDRGPECFRSLGLAKNFQRVKLVRSGEAVQWPDGTLLSMHDLLPEGTPLFPITLLAELPCHERYRPLLPLLKYGELGMYVHPGPVDPQAVIRTLGLRPGELEETLRAFRAPAEAVLPRLYDLSSLLAEQLGGEGFRSLLRRPWAYGSRNSPGRLMGQTMLDCLKIGRPDLIEFPVWNLMVGHINIVPEPEEEWPDSGSSGT